MHLHSPTPPDGAVPGSLLRRQALRAVFSTAVAATLGLAPVIVLASPAAAVPADLTITDVTAAEDDQLGFELRRPAGGVGALTLTYGTVGGTATAGLDYTDVSGSITFVDNAGGGNDQVQRITVPGKADALDELDETFSLQILDGVNAVVKTGQGVLSDDDPTPSYSLDTGPFPVDEGIGFLTVTATLSAVSGRTVVIPVSSADGNALAGQDYTAIPGSSVIVIPPGSATGTISVTIVDDVLDEDDLQSFTVVGSAIGAVGVSGTDSTVAGIADNEALPVVSVGGAGTVAEGGSLTFPLLLSTASERTVTVTVNTADDTAKAGDDYTAVVDSVVTFAPAVTGETVSVPTLNDTVNEISTEMLSLHISAPSNAALATLTAADGGITDDDVPPTVALTPGSVVEGASGTTQATFTATLSAASGRAVTVDYSVSGGSATPGADYTATSGTLTFPAGTTTKTFTVDVLGDVIDEGTGETMDVVLSNTDGTVGAGGSLGSTSVTITDDDAAPTFSVPNVALDEGNVAGTAELTVILSNPSNQTIDLAVSAADGSAVDATSGAGSNDYDAPVTVLTVAAGQSQATLSVPVVGDTVFEADETLDVTVALGVGETDATGAPDTATLALKNDDAAPHVDLSSQSGVEGTMVVVTGKVTGVAQANTPLTFTAAGGGASPAEASDFADPGSVSLAIPAGTASGTLFSVTSFLLQNDLADEPTESVVVSGSGAPGEVTVTDGVQGINDDPGDLPPTVAVGDATVNEGAGPASVPVTLTFDGTTTSTEQSVVINYATSDGSARAGVDYTAKSGQITLAPGQLSGAISVPVTADTLDEPDQSFNVNLGTITPAETPHGQTVAAVTVVDDDATKAATIDAPTVRTGTGPVTVSGQAREGTVVTLYATPKGRPTALVTTTTANSTGGYSFTRTIGMEVSFYTKADGLNSATAKVGVRQSPGITLTSAGKGKVKVRGTTNPVLANTYVSIERANANGTWTRVAYGYSGKDGSLTKTLTGLKSGRTEKYRVYVTSSPGFGILNGYSATKQIKVS